MEFFIESDIKKAVIFGDYRFTILNSYDKGLINDECIYAINDELYLIMEGEIPINNTRYFAELKYTNGVPRISSLTNSGPTYTKNDINIGTLEKFGHFPSNYYDDIEIYCVCDCEMCEKKTNIVDNPNIITKYGKIINLKQFDRVDTQQECEQYEYDSDEYFEESCEDEIY